MMTPMSLRIDKLMLLLARRVVDLMLLLARRVVDLMLLLSWRISIVIFLLSNLRFLSSLRRRLSILTRSLTMHA